MSHKVLKATPATLSQTFYLDGAVADPGVVTITITKADGTVVVEDDATDGTGAAARTYDLGPQAQLNDLTAAWSGTVGGTPTTLYSKVEIVGGFIFGVAQARAFDGAKLEDTSAYPTDTLTAARDRITDNLETLTGVSWVPRFEREELDGDGTDTLILSKYHPTEILSVSIDGTALTQDELDDLKVYPDGRIKRKTLGTWTDDKYVCVEYVHGFEHLKDGVDYIALRWLLSQVIGSNIPRTAIQQIGELGTYRLSTPGEKYPTGIPEVDAWLAAHDHTIPGVA